MCENRRAMLVSVMDGQRPQIRCEGLWRAPYMNARYGSGGSVHSSPWQLVGVDACREVLGQGERAAVEGGGG